MRSSNTPFLLFLFLSLSCLLQGCERDRKYQLSAEPKKWTPYAVDQPDMEYVNDQNQTRKIQVKYSQSKREVQGKFSLHATFYEVVEVGLMDRDAEVELHLSLEAGQGEDMLGIKAGPVSATYIVGQYRLQTHGVNDEFLASYSSRGVKYQNVIHLQCHAICKDNM